MPFFKQKNFFRFEFFLLCLLILLILVPLYLGRDTLAWKTWDIFHSSLALDILHSDDATLYFTAGDYYFHGNHYNIEKAKKYLSKAIELNPDYLEAHYQLGRIHFIQGRFSQALNEINTVLDLNPEFKKAYYMYGLINGYNENLSQAIYGFKEFIKRDSFNWAGYNDLAWVYFKLGDYEKVREVAAQGLENAPNNAWLNNIYGVALMNLGKKEEAKEAFLKAYARSQEMTPADWGIAYPGNDPAIYSHGLEETRKAIEHNLSLLDKE